MKHRSRAQTEQERWLRRKNFCSLHSHTHTHCQCRSLTHTHTIVLVCAHRARTLVLSTPTLTSTSPLPPYYAQQSTQHTQTHPEPHTYIRYIYFFISFVGLAFFDCDDFISFVFQFHFVSDKSAHSRSISLALIVLSMPSDSLTQPRQRHNVTHR